MLEEMSGDKRVQSKAAEMFMVAVNQYMFELSKAANAMANHARRKTIKEDDIRLALEIVRRA